ncbi:MAG: beta-Ala-His dipeptidase [Candidatus Hermodarchaeota archaeon]
MQSLEELGSPTEVWDYFYKITKIPRCSQKEDQIINFIKTEAEKFSFSTEVDRAKNLVVRIRSDSNSNVKKLKIVLQSHMDMVCEKEGDSLHDFSKDPLKLKIIEINNEKWLTADGTSLGADNGVGIAYQLALMKKIYNSKLNFGPLEFDLLFTASEELHPFGVTLMDKNLIDGDYLINLDGEKEDTFFIGTAGGIVCRSEMKINRISLDSDLVSLIPLKISIAGLIGGHSGMDINKGRANAIKLLTQILWKLNKSYELYINSIEGGSAMNSIPIESQARIFVNLQNYNNIIHDITEITGKIKKIFDDVETDLTISVDKLDNFKEITVFPENIKNSLLDLLYIYPSRPISFHPKDKDLVLTSTNLGVIKSAKDLIEMDFFHRSLSNYELEIIDEKICLLFKYFNSDWEVMQLDKLPCWTPDYNSNIVKTATKTYREIFNKDIQAQAVHAGCECSEFKRYYPDIEMIAIGPTIKDVHSPSERLKISSVNNIWNFLIELIKNLSQN